MNPLLQRLKMKEAALHTINNAFSYEKKVWELFKDDVRVTVAGGDTFNAYLSHKTAVNLVNQYYSAMIDDFNQTAELLKDVELSDWEEKVYNEVMDSNRRRMSDVPYDPRIQVND